MQRENFEKLVDEGISSIPQVFLDKLDNVAIVIEDEPTPVQRKELRLSRNTTLFGLYEGVSQRDRGGNYTAVLPDKITIFKVPIENAARDGEDVRQIVKDTVWHEIAHHFGMSEKEVRASEAKRLRRRS